MRFVSELNFGKLGTKNITNKAKWFNNNLSTKLNIPTPGMYEKSNEKINLGSSLFEAKHCSLYTYKLKTRIFVNPKFEPAIKPSDKKNITKVENSLKILDPNSNDKKVQSSIKSLNTKKKNLDCISKNITKCERIQIFPTNEQINLLQNWTSETLKCYNKCVDLYTKNNNYFNDGYKKTKVKVFKELYDGDKNAPYDILTDEVRKFCSNLKSCQSNLKNGHIKTFEMKHINTRKRLSTIFIPKSAIKKGSIYGSHLGKMSGLKNVDVVARDCTLTYDKVRDKYFLNTPKVVKRKVVNNREAICAVDEGEVGYVTYGSENSFGHLGLNLRPIYSKAQAEISKLQRILSKKKNKQGKKLKNKSKLKKRIQKKYDNLKNFSKEVINKMSLFLVKKYDKIILPKFETQRMIRNKKYTKEYFNKIEEEKGKVEMRKELREVTKKKRLNKKVKFSLNMQGHYKFRQHLINKADEYGCIIMINADENETTKTCTLCGSMDNKKYGRIRECLCCGTKMDRDISAQRNTLIKNVSKQEIR